MIDNDIMSGIFCIVFTLLCIIYGYNSLLIADQKKDKFALISGTVLILASPFICTLGVQFFARAGVITFQ